LRRASASASATSDTAAAAAASAAAASSSPPPPQQQHYDALVLAAAGLKRLGWSARASALLTYLRNHQQADGGWGLHIEGPSTLFGHRRLGPAAERHRQHLGCVAVPQVDHLAVEGRRLVGVAVLEQDLVGEPGVGRQFADGVVAGGHIRYLGIW
jgi:hypothetical protein